MSQFNLPDLGEGLEEAEIVAWHVNQGDHVVTDQPLVSVETDKAVVEVPSPWSGRIARLFGAKGDLVKVGAPLAEFAEGTEQDTGTVVGEIERAETPAAETKVPPDLTRPRTLQVLPAIRGLARKLDVDLNLVQATGPGGMVTRADVERAAKSLTDAGPAEPLKGMRRAMAQRMASAHAEVVPTTVTDEADIGNWPVTEDITIRLVGAIAAACRAEPSLNVWYNSQAGERRLIAHRHRHRGRYRRWPDRAGPAQCGRARCKRLTCWSRPNAGRRQGARDPAGGAARRDHHVV
jgi:pyruvate dehydrogenase E2 component (dihydrolipoamide acetyltransferase)